MRVTLNPFTLFIECGSLIWVWLPWWFSIFHYARQHLELEMYEDCFVKTGKCVYFRIWNESYFLCSRITKLVPAVSVWKSFILLNYNHVSFGRQLALTIIRIRLCCLRMQNECENVLFNYIMKSKQLSLTLVLNLICKRTIKLILCGSYWTTSFTDKCHLRLGI